MLFWRNLSTRTTPLYFIAIGVRSENQIQNLIKLRVKDDNIY